MAVSAKVAVGRTLAWLALPVELPRRTWNPAFQDVTGGRFVGERSAEGRRFSPVGGPYDAGASGDPRLPAAGYGRGIDRARAGQSVPLRAHGCRKRRQSGLPHFQRDAISGRLQTAAWPENSRYRAAADRRIADEAVRAAQDRAGTGGAQ